MYYITNHTNQIIAIDPSLLTLLEVENIDELFREIALGNTKFSSSEDKKVTIHTQKNEETFDVKYHNLSSLLGDFTLVQVQPSLNKSIPIDDDISTSALIENDEILPILVEDELVEDFLNLDIDTEKVISISDDDLISIKDSNDLLEDDISISKDLNEIVEEESKESADIKEENDDALFDLLLTDEAENDIDEISLAEEEVQPVDNSQAPIIIDIENISQSIGISIDDYNIFLNEYIDSALSFEKDLQSTQAEERSHAISTLSHLSNVLHLPLVNDIITQIENATTDDQNKHIESFYAALARLTTEKESETAVEFLDIESIKVDEEEPVETTTKGFGVINLKNVKPIHFDFQLEQAANELSLPVELIEEFVNDFIEQAHTETDKMLEAYKKGDLETIQQIGHLLKGTSSNLRINPLSDTLYEIQFCEDSSKLEAMIKHYWGHFLSLETQIKLSSN